MPSDGKGDVFVRGTTPLSQGQGDTQAPSTSLVAFGPDGWNARRTVWVRPDGSVVEISRQNDVPVMAVATVALFPIGFWEPLYWGIVFDLPREIGKATAPVDNSAAQRRLDQLVKERAGAKAQK
jgi:hypothetical protein